MPDPFLDRRTPFLNEEEIALETADRGGGGGAATRGLLRERTLRWLPIAALAALATAQIGLALGAHLSPWKGGGFGMFATIDHGAFRAVRAYARRAGGERRVAIPAELQREALRARELPTQRMLRRLARALAERTPGAELVRVEVWRFEFDAALRPSRARLAEATVEVAP